MGNIGSHVDITSGWRGHQAKLDGGESVSGFGRLRAPAWARNAVQQGGINSVVAGVRGHGG